jgi:hypothetical protein
MDAHHLVDALHDAGLSIALTPERGLKVTPAARLTPELRELIRASKGVLIDLLTRMTAPDPDRHCWPHSTAMNGAEIDRFQFRMERFHSAGIASASAERLADRLAHRDRDLDDRALCLECAHLRGHASTTLRCGNFLAAGVAIRAMDAQLPGELVTMLQRCDGFTEVAI